ncbi:hypothetical protein Pmar_PMAR015714, partial [Perkinsus marinus ATCC 50983]
MVMLLRNFVTPSENLQGDPVFTLEERRQIAERNGLDQCLEVKYADTPLECANNNNSSTLAPTAAAAVATRFPGLGMGPGGPARGGPQMGGGTATSAHYSMAKWKLGMEVMG